MEAILLSWYVCSLIPMLIYYLEISNFKELLLIRDCFTRILGKKNIFNISAAYVGYASEQLYIYMPLSGFTFEIG